MSTVYQKYAGWLPVISFALGLFNVTVGWLVFWFGAPVLAILGLVAGFMGHRFMGHMQSNQQGLALAGIVMNAFYLLVALCSTILLLANRMATT